MRTLASTSSFGPVLAGLLGCAFLVGCDGKGAGASADSAPAPAASSASIQQAEGSAEAMRRKTEVLPPAEVVADTNNPGKLPIHSGPTGTVRGRVRVSGDEAPVASGEIDKARADCQLARPMYGKLFREGNERSLADALVAVTGYEGYVAPKKDTVEIRGNGCAWDRRTVVMTFGQKLDVTAADNRTYVPELVGQTNVAQLFVMPGADPVKLVPRKPGRFLLLDSMRLYSRAEVFVLNY
ncbi:MAG TPA: hypothetical protein VLC09_09225, partial [Polyangiaceae bacterium]|nr:hypothetical protein [Polyangiaceae bacterium]